MVNEKVNIRTKKTRKSEENHHNTFFEMVDDQHVDRRHSRGVIQLMNGATNGC